MNFIIKKATAKDIDEIVKTIDFALSNDFSAYKNKTILAYRKNVYNKKYFQEFIKNNTNVVFGAYFKDKLIGFIGLKPEPGGVIFVDWLVVNKLHRSKGIGSKLLKEAENWALKHFIHYLHLYTEMPNNITYYKKRGFKLVGTYKNSWFGEDENIMAKSLRDKPFEEIFKIKK